MLKKFRKRLRELVQAVEAGRRWTDVVLPTLDEAAPSRYLSVAVVIKNEASYLAEWLDFHHRLGVDHFILYDNGSSDDTPAVLQRYIRAGLVTLIPWANFSVWFNQQRGAYAHALMNFGATSRWMGFFDIDEYMFPVTAASLTDVLREREHLPVLGVAGINFGTGGHQRPPSAGVTRSYRMAVPLSAQKQHRPLLYTKCFVRPSRVESVVSAHWFRIRNDQAFCYTEHGQPIYGPPDKHADLLSADVIRYNHYFTRSREEFERKCNGTDVRGPQPRWNRTQPWRRRMFDLIEALGQEDRVIERLLEPADPGDRLRARASDQSVVP